MQISGHTITFAVLGHPIGHSLSPVMHNRSIQALGMDAIYLAFDVAPDHLMRVLQSMHDMGFGGVNLTVPLKEVAFRGVQHHAPSAQLAGSVNTIEFLENGELRGHSTDGDGFVTAIREAFNFSLEDCSVFVLGCGGAGRAVALTCATEGATAITLGDIDPARMASVEKDIQQLATGITIRKAGTSACEWMQETLAADLIIQATPIGMKQEDPPLLKADAFRPGQCVYDLVYMFPATATITEAARAGAATANGLGMLLHQGARSFEIWTGKKPDLKVMRSALEEAVYPKV